MSNSTSRPERTDNPPKAVLAAPRTPGISKPNCSAAARSGLETLARLLARLAAEEWRGPNAANSEAARFDGSGDLNSAV
jgi:hypothetical protein